VPLLPPAAPLWFPPVESGRNSGLLAAGGDLAWERLVLAYTQGIFPWYNADTPILWWSPDPRCVLFPQEFHISRSLRKQLKKAIYSITFNQDFGSVIRHCAEVPRPGQRGTWLMPEMIQAYEDLHKRGFAMSVEAWDNGVLAGGLYGVMLGKVFFGESMFHVRPNASKVALAVLIESMRRQGMVLLDCQQTTPHMLAMGAREISRQDFCKFLAENVMPL
jgi:leucyl/phenylalanyl-tRNA--protein transferase